MNQLSESPPIGRGVFVARPATPADATPPMVEAQFLLVRQALAARQPVRRAARTARFSATTILVIGVAGIPVAVFCPSWLGFAVVIGICTIGVLEYAGARRMQRGEPSAATFLGRNQLAFLGLIVAYCVTQMLSFSNAGAGSSLVSDEVQSQLSQLPDLKRQMESLAPLVAYGFYSLVILLSVGFQGGLAVYYFTRKRHLEALQRSTPAWVQRLLVEVEG